MNKNIKNCVKYSIALFLIILSVIGLDSIIYEADKIYNSLILGSKVISLQGDNSIDIIDLVFLFVWFLIFLTVFIVSVSLIIILIVKAIKI